MKVIKLILAIVLVYFVFVVTAFLSIDSPKVEYERVLAGSASPAELTITNLRPDFSYELVAFLDKGDVSRFVVLDESNKKIFQDERILTEFMPVVFGEISGVNSAVYYFYEESRKLTDEESKYWQEFRKLQGEFLDDTMVAIRDGDNLTFGRNIGVVAQGGPYPGQEKLGAIAAVKKTVLKTVMARPKKDLAAFFLVNKIILESYRNYLTRDIGFKVFYLVVISVVLWKILRLKKELA